MQIIDLSESCEDHLIYLPITVLSFIEIDWGQFIHHMIDTFKTSGFTYLISIKKTCLSIL